MTALACLLFIPAFPKNKFLLVSLTVKRGNHGVKQGFWLPSERLPEEGHWKNRNV